MKITIFEQNDEAEVWASLETDEDPRRISESFIIGAGLTLADAITAALSELEDAKRVLCGRVGRAGV